MFNKIAFLINSMAGGGAEKLVKSLLENLNKHELSIELVCLEKNDVYTTEPNIKVTYLTDWNKSRSAVEKLVFLPILAFKLNRYLKKHDIQVVQSHLFRANCVNLITKILFRSKHNVQVVNHSVISRYKKEGSVGKINMFLIKQLYPFADKIISVSNVVQKDMQELFRFQNKKKVIYNMFDIEEIQKLASEEIDDFQLDKNQKYLISVGRLISLKRNRDLVEVLSKLDNEIELILIGTGEEKENLIELSDSLGISKRVHFLGWVENPYKYIKNTNLLVCASETESFGNVLVEAMACGTPILSTRCGGPEEIIEDGVNGSLVDIGTIDAMVASINKILNDNKLYEVYIQNGYDSCKKFDVKNITQEYIKILGVEW